MTKVNKIIKGKEHNCFIFKPDSDFYERIRVNRKRLGQIYRGEIEPNVSEAKAIAEFFEVPVTELIN